MTSQALPSPSLPRPAPPRRHLLARIARRLVEAEARARDRRRLEDLSDWLRADAGLPPRPEGAWAMRDLFLRSAFLR